MHVCGFGQDVKQGQKALWRYQDMVRQLLRQVQGGIPPAPHTLAAPLLAVKAPVTGEYFPVLKYLLLLLASVSQSLS